MVRTTRWARRKPALATLSVVSALLLVAALGGALFFTQRLARERDRAAASEKQAQAQLWRAYLEQARATRIAPQMGRRFASLEAIAAAARIRPSLELRNAAAGALVLDDIVLDRRWPRMRSSIDTPVAFDANLERYALPATRWPHHSSPRAGQFRAGEFPCPRSRARLQRPLQPGRAISRRQIQGRRDMALAHRVRCAGRPAEPCPEIRRRRTIQ
jgi:hypothetical protein